MAKESYDAEITLTGTGAMLMHADDVMAADALDEWRKDEKNEGQQKRGDDRSPAWTWHTYLYTDLEHLTIPSANIMSALAKAGAKIVISGKTTLKEFTQSSIGIDRENLPFYVDGKQIPYAAIEKIREAPFAEQFKAVQKLGFKLDVRRAKIGRAKHVRVRPRFENWETRFRISVDNVEVITPDRLQRVFDILGKKGLGDWRPSSPSGGVLGKAEATVKFL